MKYYREVLEIIKRQMISDLPSQKDEQKMWRKTAFILLTNTDPSHRIKLFKQSMYMNAQENTNQLISE